MAPVTPPLRRGLALWIAALLAASGLVVASRQSNPETTLVASGGPRAVETERPAATTTTAPAETTTSTAAPVVSVPAPTSTTVAQEAPTTTVAAPTTTTTAPAPTVSITPNVPLSASPGSSPDHYMLAGAGCPGTRVMLNLYGGQFDGDFYDVPSTLPDGTWGIGMMVAIPGTYEMHAACQDAGGTTLFEYAPLTFTILP